MKPSQMQLCPKFQWLSGVEARLLTTLWQFHLTNEPRIAFLKFEVAKILALALEAAIAENTLFNPLLQFLLCNDTSP